MKTTDSQVWGETEHPTTKAVTKKTYELLVLQTKTKNWLHIYIPLLIKTMSKCNFVEFKMEKSEKLPVKKDSKMKRGKKTVNFK